MQYGNILQYSQLQACIKPFTMILFFVCIFDLNKNYIYKVSKDLNLVSFYQRKFKQKQFKAISQAYQFFLVRTQALKEYI